MEFKGTKGEWKIEESYCPKYKQKILNISTEEIEGLSVIYTGGESFEKTQQENAKLIAAAPDLLEALRDMMFIFEGLTDKLPTPYYEFSCYTKAKQAIEKALKL